MAEIATDVLVPAGETTLTPREQLLGRVMRVLLGGAFLNVALGFVLILAIVIGRSAGLFGTFHNALLGRYAGPDDVATAGVILFLLANAGLLMILMVGTMAQEFWTPAGIVLLILVNIVAMLLLGFIPALITIGAASWAGYIGWRDRKAFRVNPVSLKEVRGRMRGMRAFIIISVYLGLMSGFTVLLYLIQTQVDITSGTAITGELGRLLFLGVVGMELLLIIFIAPAFTAGAITGERERKTYDLLQTTLLPVPSFIVGKLESALSYILLLLMAAVPLQSIAFLFGGVSETEIILAFFILAVTAVALGATGLFFSSLTDRTLTASVRAYTTALVVTFGIPVILSLFLGVFNSAISSVSSGITGDATTEALFIYIGMVAAALNPVTAALYSQRILIDHQQVLFFNVTLVDGSMIPVVSPWVLFVIFFTLISAILLILTVRGVNRANLQD